MLVHTGVYEPAKGPPAHTPTQQAEDVFSAVKQVLIQQFERPNERLQQVGASSTD